MTRRWTCGALLMLVLGCGGAPPGKAPSAPTASPKPIESAGPRETEDDLRLDLLDPGAQPRTALRYQFHLGQREKMVIDLQMNMTMEPPGQNKVTVALPTMESTYAIGQKDVTKEGDLHYEFLTERIDVLPDPGVQPEIAAKLRDELKQLVGLKGDAVVSSRGLMRRTHYDIPEGVTQRVRQSIENIGQALRQIATPFPREPVGTGARWKTTSTVDMKMFKLTQTSTYSLVSIEGNRVVIDVQIEQRAPRQPVKMKGLPPDVKTTLESFETHGTGHQSLNLDAIAPTSESEIETQSRFTAEQGTEAVGFGNAMKMKTKVRSN